ncbi:MAG: UDP-4-amino-4,6-dideoxy-N-acetyl-beta-L-altrosamine transaminase [Bacteroidia bacterium]
MKAIPYGRQHITEEDIQAVVETLKSDYLTQGPKIQEFEEKFAAYVSAKYAVAVANGTAALHLCAMALEVNENTNVITTPITFAASANCVRYCGGNVFFADIDPDTFLLDINKVRALIESKPKGFFHGIIPVDFSGYPVDLEAFRKLADEHGLWIIEDACHAPGGYFTDSKNNEAFCGNGIYADLAIFSFHPVKHIATGEGGMITTNDAKLYEKLKLLRTHGITKDPNIMHENHGGWYYEMVELGYNYRLPDMLATLGITQLNRAEKGLQRRQEIADKYNAAFEKTHIKTPKFSAQGKHAYHLYIIRSENRLALYNHLREKNIFAQVHYIPVHLMPYYKQFGWKKGDFPIAESYYENCLSLPMYPSLTNEEQDYVIESVLNFK